MGKYILSILGILSLIWIGYVGINLTAMGKELSPQTVFGKQDRSIIVIHNPLEPDYQEERFRFLSENSFYTSILTHTERIQHFYFSPQRKLVLLERSKPWTLELVDRYFASLSLDTELESAKTFRLSNGWFARYDKEYLLISSNSSFQPAETETIQWKYVDRKSTATLISWEKGKPLIENAYRSTASEISYIAQTDDAGIHLTDDQDVFQDIIPADFDELLFYEKAYLRSVSGNRSSLYEWMASGIISVRKGNAVCFISDCIPGQDPLAILGERLDENSISENKTSAFVRNTALPSLLTTSKDWYIEVFNSRVFISTEKGIIDDLIGSYETGATLSQNESLRVALFARTPKKVSFRHITAQEHRTISLLNHSRHTVVLRFDNAEKENDQNENTNIQPLSTIRIDGGISALFPVQGTNFLYVLSKTNVLYGIQGDEERWKTVIEGAIIGKPLLSSAETELVITTSTAIHQITRNGSDLNGQAVSLNNIPSCAAVPYSWKGNNQLAVLTGQQLVILNTNGTRKTTLAVPSMTSVYGFAIWANVGELTATIAGKSKGVHLSLDRKRKIKEFTLPESAFEVVKTTNGVRFYGIYNGQLVIIDHKGKQTTAGNSAQTILSIDQISSGILIAVKCRSKLCLFREDGTLQQTITPSFGDIASASSQSMISGKTVIGILDGIANKNYIYSMNGKPFTTTLFDGGSILVLHRVQNGKLILISQSNNYLVRYPIDN